MYIYYNSVLKNNRGNAMKITKRQLKRIIKEEKAKLLKEQGRPGRAEAEALLEKYTMDYGIPAEKILDYVLFSHLSGDMAYEAMAGFEDEL